MKEFNPQDRVTLKIGGNAVIKSKLGEGGQGVVYLIDLNGVNYALKWYTKPCKKEFYDNLDQNIKAGAPNSAFLWPLYLTEWQGQHFGYVMALRPIEYKDFSQFLLAKARFASLSAMLSAAFQISNAFRELHTKGYSYQDLNDGNFFIHPQTGNVLICDNDNVAPYGKNLGITGKCRYMAPEVVLGKSKPNADTDRFSLSILLFMLFFNNHPLEGKLIASVPCMTDEYEKRFYGSNPLFIFDPTNNTNHPIVGIHTNAIRRWPLFPQFIKNEFIHAFSKDCFEKPNTRKTEHEWRKLFVNLRNATIKCGCGSDTFIDPSKDDSCCINCGKNLGRPLTLNVQSSNLILYPSQRVYACHTKENSDEYSTQTGEVIQNKVNPSLWGIRNLSNDIWVMTLPDGNTKDVKPNEVVPVLKDVKILFSGGLKGQIN